MSTDLFSSNESLGNQPLAYRMSPRTLDEYIGQEHIVGPGRLLRRVIQADRLSSLIFYGPPGTGKTSLAKVIARTTSSAFASLNAVLSGVKELREVIKEAGERRDLYGTRTILFIDEVHRWNKAQQDALLPWVENGTVILVGATTQNPYFEVNSALVSRSRIFQLLPLDEEDLRMIAEQALADEERGYGAYQVQFETGALEHLIRVSAGDARSLLNALELAVETTPDAFPPPDKSEIFISMDVAEQSIQKKAVLYDKEGDYHFDTISAFIKSLRGSDPDAALYWLSRMVYAGEDPRFIFRRMLISASEDVGMADPHALSFVEAAAAAFDRVGMPEGRYHLAHAALYLATAPKSNSTLGFFDALAMVEEENRAEIPVHLKDGSRDSQGFGHGAGYLYPHAYRDHWVEQQYLPSSLQGRVFYQASDQGYEASIRTDVARRREAQLAAAFNDASDEILTFSPVSNARDRWIQRILDKRGAALSAIRERIMQAFTCPRHARICVVGAEEGTLVWEALRRVPEGGVTGLILSADSDREEMLRHYAGQIDTVEGPELRTGAVSAYLDKNPERTGTFEFVIGRNYTTRSPGKTALFSAVFDLLDKKGQLVLAESVPRRSQRLSDTVRGLLGGKGTAEDGRDTAAAPEPYSTPANTTDPYQATPPPSSIDEDSAAWLDVLAKAEERLYRESAHPLLSWDAEDLAAGAREAGFSEISTELFTVTEERFIRPEDIDRWLNPGGEGLTIGTYLALEEQTETVEELISWLKNRVGNTRTAWTSTLCLLHAVKPPRSIHPIGPDRLDKS